MKHICYLIILILTFTVSETDRALGQISLFPFSAKTVDEFHWKDTVYMCNISPLSSITGYQFVYEKYSICHRHYELPISQDKNYKAQWTVIDGILYLYGVRSACAIPESDNDMLDMNLIEKFLNAKFSLNALPVPDRGNERFKNGVIPATWFSDTLYIKRYPGEGEKFWENEYKLSKFNCLIFDKGHLMEEKLVTLMERHDEFYYPKKKLIIQESNKKITCITGSQSISTPFCIDRENIKSVNDNYDRNNRCIAITFKNEPEMMRLSEICKGENYKKCIYMIDEEVIVSDPTLFMIEKSIIYKLEKVKCGQNVTMVKIRTRPEKEDDLMIRLTPRSGAH